MTIWCGSGSRSYYFLFSNRRIQIRSLSHTPDKFCTGHINRVEDPHSFHLVPDPDPDPALGWIPIRSGSNPYPGLYWPKIKKSPSYRKGHPKCKNMNYKKINITFVGHFCPPGSGSVTLHINIFRIRIPLSIILWFYQSNVRNSVGNPYPGSGMGKKSEFESVMEKKRIRDSLPF